MRNISYVVMCFLFKRITFTSVPLCLTALYCSTMRGLATGFVSLIDGHNLTGPRKDNCNKSFIYFLASILRQMSESEIKAHVERKRPLSV